MKWKNQVWQELLADLRGLKMTQQVIGEAIGVGRSQVCRMISGETAPSYATYTALEDLHKANIRAINKAKREGK